MIFDQLSTKGGNTMNPEDYFDGEDWWTWCVFLFKFIKKYP